MSRQDPSVHPLYILITLVLGSISALFLGFSAAFLYSKIQGSADPIHLPSMFFTNSVLLLLSSWLFVRTRKAYEADDTANYKRLLWLILALSMGFLILQLFAWQQMIEMNQYLGSGILSSYLYIISAAHFIHVMAGIPFLIYFIRDAHERLIEPASVLLYLSDPDKKRKLRVLTIYWHFLDLLWIYLLLFFAINSLF